MLTHFANGHTRISEALIVPVSKPAGEPLSGLFAVWVPQMPQRPPKHHPPGWRPAPAKRAAVQDPYYGTAAWKKLRAAALKRDDYQCVGLPGDPCRTPDRGRGGRLHVDHIQPRRDGGPDALPNLRTLCPACDNRRHGRRG